MKTFDKTDDSNNGLYNDRAYKILEADHAFDVGLYEEKKLKNGTVRKVKSKAVLKQKVIITFSRKMMEYQRFIRSRQIDRAKKLLKNLDPETYKKGPNDVTRFIKRVSSTKSGEEVNDRYEIDQSVIDEEEKYDGFYAVATNLDDSAKDIIEISSNRYKIEDCFHKNKTHFSIENITETLKNMEVVNVGDMYYMSTYNGSQICTALNTVFDLELDKKYYLPKELNKKIKKIST